MTLNVYDSTAPVMRKRHSCANTTC